MPQRDKLQDADWLVLTPDEEVISAKHPSIWPSLQQIVIGVIMAIVGIGVAIQVSIFGLVLVPIGLMVAAIAEIQRRHRWYVLTTEQVWKKRGIISQRTVQSRFDDVENITLSKSITERVLNFGDIKILTSGTDMSEFRLENVPNPTQYKTKAIEQLDIVNERGYMQSREEAEEIAGGNTEGDEQQPSEGRN